MITTWNAQETFSVHHSLFVLRLFNCSVIYYISSYIKGHFIIIMSQVKESPSGLRSRILQATNHVCRDCNAHHLRICQVQICSFIIIEVSVLKSRVMIWAYCEELHYLLSMMPLNVSCKRNGMEHINYYCNGMNTGILREKEPEWSS